MKRIVGKILFIIFTAIEILLMPAMYYLQSLTKKKAGVNHHLRYRKTQYRYKYFTETNIRIMEIVLVVVIIICIVFLVKNIQKYGAFAIIGICMTMIWALVIGVTLKTDIFQDLLVYPYLVFSELAAFGLSIINIKIGVALKKK